MKKLESYRNEEQQIEHALNTGAKELDLSGEKLIKLPESLKQLTQLKKLNIAYNHLTELPDWLGQLSQLKMLNISGNQLTELPDWLGQLSQLEMLNISGNQLTELPDWLGQLSQLRTLDISGNQLTALPVSLSHLTLLEFFIFDGNQLIELPVWLGQLTQLKSLGVANNQLTELPDWLSQLSHLKELDISGNQLTELPKCLGKLSELNKLYVGAKSLTSLHGIGNLQTLDELILGSAEGSCQFNNLPSEIRLLKQLKKLWLFNCGLSSLPDWIGELCELNELHLGYNQIKEIPSNLGGISHLDNLLINKNLLKDIPASLSNLRLSERLLLDGNPLNPELAAANNEGIDSVKRYLRELAKGAQKRYEAKLLILGDGNEGKTCVSRALRGLPFRKQNSTHGVDVVQWKLTHPDDSANSEKDITLNIWDFEGQEISHQTHQFFLTSQSLYLLVFKCRDLFLLDRAEYWLDTIRARAPKAKVAIVISQCEGRSPVVPLDRIQAQYSDLLAEEWFFPIGCENGFNVPELTFFLKRWAADMEYMGSPWPMSYGRAEVAIKSKAKRTAYITRDKLYTIFDKAGLSKAGHDDAAAAMSRLGVLTQFPDCPDLRNFIVLRPQWLTKAISKMMEDKKLSEEKGEIALHRMEAMWKIDYPGMYATFHDCMKEFELCYDLDDGNRCCLVPLRFGYLRPEIPWTKSQNLKERRVEYKLNIRPPMGIMSRFIVKTHHMIIKTADHPKGIFWHNGVFLFSGTGTLRSEALCEFLPEERKLRIEVRAAYPQNMCEQIHAYVKAVFSFFSGLETERSYGCIKVHEENGAEESCKGLHTEKRIYTAISKQRPSIDCEFEDHEVDPRILVGGFGSFNEFVKLREIVRQELDKQPLWAEPYLNSIGSLWDWVHTNGEKLDQLLLRQSALPAEFKQEAELKLQQFIALTSELLDDRDYTSAPSLITISPKKHSKWNPQSYFKQTYMLTPYCECPGNIHSCEDGQVEFIKDKEWWAKSAPWIARGTKLLSTGLQLAFSGMPIALNKESFDAIKDDVDFMNKLAEHMELEEGDENILASVVTVAEFGGGQAEGDKDTRLTRFALAHLLEELAPINYHARQWGSLRRVRMSDNTYRWLCTDCARRSR